MSGPLLELIIFAAIAVFLVSKLLSILGSTSEDDPARNRNGFFGEPGAKAGRGMKHVKSVASSPKKAASFAKKLAMKPNVKGLVVKENKEDVLKGLSEVQQRMPNFSLNKFVNNSKLAFQMILQAGIIDDEEDLEELVDKRYLDHFRDMAPSYGNVAQDLSKLKAEVSEIYMFGNNVFIKVLFAGKNVTDTIHNMHEEWTFSKNALADGPAWHLTNIDRPQ